VRALVVFLCVATTIACGDDPVPREAERLLEQTTPARVATPYLSLTRNTTGVDAEWTFRLTVSWADYRMWVVDRLAPDYSCKIDATTVRCSRALAGDTYTVAITPRENNEVRVVFTARAS
jgi:hypothetical protein